MKHSELLEPTMVITNEKGDILYAHKDKGDYCLFEICSENTMGNDEWEFTWRAITSGARAFGVKLFDHEEVLIESIRIAHFLDIEDDNPTSIEISILDHASREMTELTVRVTATKELPEHLRNVKVKKGET